MAAGPQLPGELTWPKLLGTCLAAVVAAWLAGYLGLGNTLSGVAIGSVIATFGAAFFTTTIDKTQKVIPTVLVRTDRGTVVEAHGEQDVVLDDASRTTVLPAQADEPTAMAPSSPASGTDAPSRWSQIQWKSVAIASLITMGITLGAISIYESAVGRTWGSNEPGTSIGNTVRGGPAPIVTPTPTPTPTPTEEPSPTEEPTDSATPTATPTDSATPTPTATPTDECPTPTPSIEPDPDASDPECPTPTASPGEDDGLLP